MPVYISQMKHGSYSTLLALAAQSFPLSETPVSLAEVLILEV